MNIRQHIQTLLTQTSQGLYEKDHIIALAILCAISGESLFLLGPPGTAKSEIARRLKKIFLDASAFEYLMSRFSIPDEVFGPVSLQKLKTEDTYERKIEGFLPAATIVFLDEIWKAGPAIQNALLTVLNEKIYRNGRQTIHLPMKCLIAASNELPAENEGLEALWDRFLVRVISNCINDERTFYEMLTMTDMPSITIPQELLLTDELLMRWQKQINSVKVPNHILKAITIIRKELVVSSKEEKSDHLDYYISDRRWRKNIRILRTSAFLNGRTEVDRTDLFLLVHTLWNKVTCIDNILRIVSSSLFYDLMNEANNLDAECKKIVQDKYSDSNEEETKNFKIFDLLYYALKNHPIGKCYLYERDYKKIRGECLGLLYYDKKLKAHVIRKYDKYSQSSENSIQEDIKIVSLSKSNTSLVIDGVAYEFITQDNELSLFGSILKRIESTVESSLSMHTNKTIKSLQSRIEEIKISQNLFLSKEDLKIINSHANKIEKQLNVILAKTKNL